MHAARYYPGLAHPRLDQRGVQTARRQDKLVTDSGWGVIPLGLMCCVHDGLPVAARLSAAERMRERFPAIREAEETAGTRTLTPGEEMAYAVNLGHARKRLPSGRRRFDEWNRPR